MRRLLFCLSLFFLAERPLQAQGDDLLDKVIALQKLTQKAIAKAEPSIACILVSRSEDYRRLGAPSWPEQTGRLPAFDPSWLRNRDRNDEQYKKERARLDLSDPQHIPQAFGSGVVIDAKGLILTNFHVVRGATMIFVRLPGGKGSFADIHAGDPRSDLAVLKLHKSVGQLHALPLGEADKLERGQFVLALANPFAAGVRDGQPSASWGIISNIRRRTAADVKEEERVKPLHYYGTLLQTDVRLQLGCSGGALLNLKGELIGLTTALAAVQGTETPGGFAIPMDITYRRIIEVLKRGEEVEYGFLGVAPSEAQLASGPGVVIQNVTINSPASQAKLRSNGVDTIVAIDGVPVRDVDDLLLFLGSHLAGAKVQLDVRRQNSREITKVEATLAKLLVPGKTIASSLGKRPFFRGLRVDYTTLLYQQSPWLFSNTGIPPGVMISEVQPGSAAAKAELKIGEVITHVNNQPVLTPAQFYDAVAAVRGEVEFTLYSFTPMETPVRVKVP